jgi:hypothetical protein
MAQTQGEILYIIPFEYGTSTKQVRIIQMCLNETRIKVLIGKHLSNTFVVQIDLKQEDVYRHCFQFHFHEGSRKLGAGIA